MAAPGTDRWQALAALHTEGEWHWRVHAFADEWATWLHSAAIKIPAGVDVELMLEIGARLLARAPRRAIVQRAAAAARLAGERRRTLGGARRPEAHRGDRRPDRSRAWTPTARRSRSGSSASGPASAPGTSSSRAARAPSARRTAPGPSGTFRTAAASPARSRGHGLRRAVPAAHPPDRDHRSARARTTRSTAGPNDPGSPWAIGARGGRARCHPSRSRRRRRTSRTSWAPRPGRASRSPSTSPCRHPRITRGCASTRSGSRRCPDGTIALRGEPAQEVPGHLPDQLRQRSGGHPRRGAAHRPATGSGVGVRIFRVDNPHTKPLQFWELVLHEINAEFPDVVFLAEAFTRPAMLQSLAQVGFQQSYTYFTWRNTKTELEEFLHGLSHGTCRVPAPEPLRQHPRHPHRVPAVRRRRRVQGARGDRRDREPELGRLRGLRAVRARRAAGHRGEHRQREVRVQAARLGRGAKRRRVARAVPDAAQRDPRRAPGAAPAAQPATCTAATTTRSSCTRRCLDGPRSPARRRDAIIVVANVDPHSVRETIVHLDLTALGLRGGRVASPSSTSSPARRYGWGSDNYVRLDAFAEPVHILHVQAGPKRPYDCHDRRPTLALPTTSPRSSPARTRSPHATLGQHPSTTAGVSAWCDRSPLRSPSVRGGRHAHPAAASRRRTVAGHGAPAPARPTRSRPTTTADRAGSPMTRTASCRRVGEVDLYLWGEGRHEQLWHVLGAHCRPHEDVAGTSVQRLGAARARRAGDRRLQRLERRRPRHATPRRQRGLGALRARPRARYGVQVRVAHPGRRMGRARRPDGALHRGAAGDGIQGRAARSSTGATASG